MQTSKKTPDVPSPKGTTPAGGEHSFPGAAKLPLEELKDYAQLCAEARNRSNDLMARSRRILCESDMLLRELKLMRSELTSMGRRLRSLLEQP